MPKDTPESIMRNAETIRKMLGILVGTEGPAACSRWFDFLIDEVIERRQDDRYFGYHLLKNIKAHIENELAMCPSPRRIEGGNDGKEIFQPPTY